MYKVGKLSFKDGQLLMRDECAKKYRDALVIAYEALKQYGNASVYVGASDQNESVAARAVKQIERIFEK